MKKTILLKLKKLFNFSNKKKEDENKNSISVAGPTTSFTVPVVENVSSNPANSEKSTNFQEESASGVGEIFNLVKGVKGEMKEIKERAKNTENIVYLGFIILLVMVTGLVFGFWYFVYNSSTNKKYIDQEYLDKEIGGIKEDMEKNKKIADDNNGTIKCLEYKGYFSNSCFKH